MTKVVTDILLNGALYNSDTSYDKVYSVIEYVNTLTGATNWEAGGFYTIDELPDDVLISYFVDYYDAQVQRGGLSQFIIASGWNPHTNNYIRDGLERMEANAHLSLFLEVEVTLAGVAHELEELLIHDFDGSNPIKTALDLLSQRFTTISETENLMQLNADYISTLETKKVLSPRALWQMAIDALLAKVPDREERKRADYEQLSPEMKLIVAVCEQAEQKLVTYHDFKLIDFEGKELASHEITTDQGKHHVIFTHTDILLCDNQKGEIVARCKKIEG